MLSEKELRVVFKGSFRRETRLLSECCLDPQQVRGVVQRALGEYQFPEKYLDYWRHENTARNTDSFDVPGQRVAS